MSSNQQLEIEICMGSSCFSRGNHQSLEIIQSFIQKHNLQADIQVKGCLCQNQCTSGPMIRINGDLYQKVEPVTVIDILEESLKSRV